MGKTCKAPESIKGFPQDAIDQLGQKIEDFAEDTIFHDYTFFVGINPTISTFPSRASDGTQYFRDATGINTQLFIAFLATNNPNVNVQALSIQALMAGGGIKNPDWMIHRKVAQDFEFYEVKPKSSSGTREGNKKLLFFAPFFALNNLPYTPGIKYNPQDREEIMWIETKGFFETTITLRWSRTLPGLIQYDVCVETRLRQPGRVKVKNPFDAVTLALLLMIWLGIELAPAAAI
ncbi:hypothetical protein ACFFWD_36595 [Bradyrhizobium erythrophlei]|uniref:hypothetical protein n=1 Tax=Bradyrhizobium erythrophlei TaxID=1437360 RepID=UPI0035EAF4DE